MMQREKSARRSLNRVRVLRFIRDFYADNGFSPSFREIALGTGIRSTSTVSVYIHDLIEDGILSGCAARPRRLKITEYGATEAAEAALTACAPKPIETIA